MVIINFYKKYNTNWDELQMLSLDIIARLEKESQETVTGELSIQQQYDDYRDACMQGMKTFIMQVLNDWENIDILVLNNQFYKKFQFMEMDGILKRYHQPNLFKNSKELFEVFNKEKFQLTPDEFDDIYEIFSNTDDVICNVSSFEYEIKDIKEDKSFLDDIGFNDLME